MKFEGSPNFTETAEMCAHGNFPASCEACKEREEKTSPKETFNKSRIKLMGIPDDDRGQYLRQKFEEVLRGLDATVDHQLLNAASIEMISVEPKTIERPDGTIVINISRGDVAEIISKISEIINRRGKQPQNFEASTPPGEESVTSAPANIKQKQVIASPEVEQIPQRSIESEVADWGAKYGIRLSHVGSKINPETFSRNAGKLTEAFQRVITEKDTNRLERSSFTLVDSGGSRYRDGEKYIDITDDPQKIYELLVRHTGSGR